MDLAPDDPTSDEGAIPRPASLWPSVGLATALTLLVGLPLWVQGFTFSPVKQAGAWMLAFGSSVVIAAGARIVWGALRGRLKGVTRGQVLRQVASGAAAVGVLAVVGAVYSWGKLLVPLFRERAYDSVLYAADLSVHFGLDPAQILLALLDAVPGSATAVDWAYNHYLVLLTFTIAWFFTHPDLDQRHRFVRAFVLLWSGGLAGYWLVPALGPAFVFADLVPVIAERFPRSHGMQVALLDNYRHVMDVLADRPAPPIQIAYGVAAMPSLHVGVPAFGLFWCWQERHPLRLPYLLATLLMLLGCVTTGWHYLIDGYAGVLLALVCVKAVRTPRGNAPGDSGDAEAGDEDAAGGDAEEDAPGIGDRED